jgi:16S rRNA (guanine527-N7)-methyltransferase
VQVHEGRAERWRPPARFAAVITRGFADLVRFVAACRHLLAEDGELLAMKGTLPRDEVDLLPTGIEVREIIALRVPRLDAARHLVRMRLHAA